MLNKLNPNWNLETGEVSLALGRGRHTTRVVELFSLFDGKVMDTPGFSSLDFHNITKEELKKSFLEINNSNCKFKDCNHINETGCEVIKKVNDNSILKSRYDNYLRFLNEVGGN